MASINHDSFNMHEDVVENADAQTGVKPAVSNSVMPLSIR